jgi:hypothetical protein
VPERPVPSLPDLADAGRAFLACVSYQSPYLLSRNCEGTAYVGRRLDHAWRALDHLAGAWVEERYQEDGAAPTGLGDLGAAIARARSLPPVEAAIGSDSPNVVANDHLQAARAMVERLLEALSGDELHVGTVAVHLHLARRAFSAYRLAKYRWLEREYDAGEYRPQAAYRWLEA